jgi:hypothetical protein
MDQWFTAYFRRDNFSTGNTAVLLEGNSYPQRLAWEGGVYQLDFANDTAPEAHYEYVRDLPEHPSE